MSAKHLIGERELTTLAKRFREASGQSKADIARKLHVAPPSIFNAEERPELSLTALRIRIIEACSPFRVVGPVFQLKEK